MWTSFHTGQSSPEWLTLLSIICDKASLPLQLSNKPILVLYFYSHHWILRFILRVKEKSQARAVYCICEADRTNSHRYVWETCRRLFRAGDCVCAPLCVQRQQQAVSCVEVTSRWTRRAECSADSGGSKWLCGRWSLCQGRKMAAQEHQRAPLHCTSSPAPLTHAHTTTHTRTHTHHFLSPSTFFNSHDTLAIYKDILYCVRRDTHWHRAFPRPFTLLAWPSPLNAKIL